MALFMSSASAAAVRPQQQAGGGADVVELAARRRSHELTVDQHAGLRPPGRAPTDVDTGLGLLYWIFGEAHAATSYNHSMRDDQL